MILAAAQVEAKQARAMRHAHPALAGTLWGYTTQEMHDAYWASYGVQVVRPGGPAPARSGPSLYLLVEADRLVQFDLEPVLKLLHWASPEVVRIRVSEASSQSYREHVRSDAHGRLISIERKYRSESGPTGRAWITASSSLARAWHGRATPGSERSVMRELSAKSESVPCAARGVAARLGCDEDRRRWLDAVMRTWTRPRAVCSSVYEAEPGVFVHETARVPGSCRIIGPVWIGAGVALPERSLVIGPRVLEDTDAVPSTAPVDWGEVKSRHYELPALTRFASARSLIKRTFDIVFSLCVVAGTLPIYPLAMLAIYLEDGRPFFFAHTRQTRGGKNFPCIKFRTMVNDAEKIKAKLKAENMADGPQFFIENDPRLLRCGKILRKFQIDELPQFFNVLAGHMSVVGPRPSPDKENQYCPAWREGRLSVRPGVTGLWQVKRTRAPDTDFQEWIQYDLEYIQHQSFWRDLSIIAETAFKVFRGG